MNKQEFFHRPTTVGEILDTKMYVVHANSNIAERVDEISEDVGLIVPALVPEEFAGRLKFLKRAPQVVLDVGRSQADAIQRGLSPSIAYRNAINNLAPAQYCGAVWRSLRRNEHNRVTLDESIKGTKLFAWSEISGSDIEVTPYTDANVSFYGGKFKLRVPSRTPKQSKHELTMESVPVRKSKFNPVIWTDIGTTHYCGVTGNDFSYRYVSAKDFCAHEIAGAIKLAKDNTLLTRDRVPYEFLPFPTPTEATIGYYNKLVNNVMVEEEIGGNKRKRPLNNAEREILLWDFVRMNGYESTFGQKSKKFTEYKWAA